MKGKGSSAIIDDVAAFYVYEYTQRMRMHELGFMDNLDNLDCITAEAFTIISNEIEKVKSEEMKKKTTKR